MQTTNSTLVETLSKSDPQNSSIPLPPSKDYGGESIKPAGVRRAIPTPSYTHLHLQYLINTLHCILMMEVSQLSEK